MERNLKSLRDSLGLTQKQFAESLGIKLTTYNGYETGTRDPDSDFWAAVAIKYNVTIEYLMGYSDDPKRTGIGKEETPPTPAEPEWEERLTNSNLDVVLKTLGIVDVGQDLSEADAKFLADLLNLVRTWLQEKGKHH